MIRKITMNNVTSYKNPVTLETDKKVNLIYGLNGTGKSTFSDFLYDISDPRFTRCSVEGLTNEEILVYNQSFIRDYFFQPDNLKGIFTLSKENKEAEEKIKSAEKEVSKLDSEMKSNLDLITKHRDDMSQKLQNAINNVWDIKTKFTGGDRVLEYCLSGLMGKKETLFNYLLNIVKPDEKPSKTIEQIRKEAETVQGSTAQKYDFLPKINFSAYSVESNSLFKKTIIGNENSIVADLIKRLRNSDWVKKGLEYVPEEIETEEICPFCQERTISKTLVGNIQNYFDETYENDISKLKELLNDYYSGIDLLPQGSDYENHLFIVDKKSEFENLYRAIEQRLKDNMNKITTKIETPSQEVILEESNSLILNFNKFIENVNDTIKEHNNKIDNKEKILKEIKKQFWNIMRWDYDQTLFAYQKDKSDIDKKIENLNNEVIEGKGKIYTQNQIIVEQQKNTINIDEAINNINNGLIELGIDGFRIESYQDVLYKIVRTEKCENTFETLSEGEKMIISFLYFLELCKGKKTALSHSNKKIIVIDDPISSLSHIFIFNIGQMIKNDIFNSPNYEQIFLLTHSLYFFYEMAIANHEKRKESQKLFRISKNNDGSQISYMKYEEIQNDYHSYWYIVKDDVTGKLKRIVYGKQNSLLY